ncbi:hypothetical protein [Streptomyces exfoliatus]|uniref:hypothetical protein n=1 Tax=Streptomyces exfoliatus TaxID=1905 RepID=UPI00068D56DB|nr:hypothetical protein [Streptomyces exfoliatus]
MAVLEDGQLSAATPRPLAAAAALALAALLTAGCTDGTVATSDTPSSSATEQPTGTQSPQEEGEEEQGKRAKAALEKHSLDEPEYEPNYVESGLERVTEGVHNLSMLEKGKAYEVAVACVGKGAVKVVITDKTAPSVPCNGVSVSRRIENAPAEFALDITATAGATGMVAWQVSSVQR